MKYITLKCNGAFSGVLTNRVLSGDLGILLWVVCLLGGSFSTKGVFSFRDKALYIEYIILTK